MHKIVICYCGLAQKVQVEKILLAHPKIHLVQVEVLKDVSKPSPIAQAEELEELIFTLNKEMPDSDIFKRQDSFDPKWRQKYMQKLKIELPKVFRNIKKNACIRNKLWRK